MIQTKSFILECEQDPVHPYSYRKVQCHPKPRPNAGQYRCVLPVMVAELDDENAARIQTRTASAGKWRRKEQSGLPVPDDDVENKELQPNLYQSYSFSAN